MRTPVATAAFGSLIQTSQPSWASGLLASCRRITLILGLSSLSFAFLGSLFILWQKEPWLLFRSVQARAR